MQPHEVPAERRGETTLQRADRNWDELLSELRVTQTGVAVLFSLLLTVPFSARFAEVTAFQRQVYLAALLLSACSAVSLVAPVAYHRVLFAQRQKPQVVTFSNRLALTGLGFLCLALAVVLLLVASLLMPLLPAVLLSAGFGLATGFLWFVPALLRRRTSPGLSRPA